MATGTCRTPGKKALPGKSVVVGVPVVVVVVDVVVAGVVVVVVAAGVVGDYQEVKLLKFFVFKLKRRKTTPMILSWKSNSTTTTRATRVVNVVGMRQLTE